MCTLCFTNSRHILQNMKPDFVLSVIDLSHQTAFFNALSHTKIVNTEKKLSSSPVFLFVFPSPAYLSQPYRTFFCLLQSFTSYKLPPANSTVIVLPAASITYPVRSTWQTLPDHAFSAALENIYIQITTQIFFLVLISIIWLRTTLP